MCVYNYCVCMCVRWFCFTTGQVLNIWEIYCRTLHIHHLYTPLCPHPEYPLWLYLCVCVYVFVCIYLWRHIGITQQKEPFIICSASACNLATTEQVAAAVVVCVWVCVCVCVGVGGFIPGFCLKPPPKRIMADNKRTTVFSPSSFRLHLIRQTMLLYGPHEGIHYRFTVNHCAQTLQCL